MTTPSTPTTQPVVTPSTPVAPDFTLTLTCMNGQWECQYNSREGGPLPAGLYRRLNRKLYTVYIKSVREYNLNRRKMERQNVTSNIPAVQPASPALATV